jgi:flagellar basal body-associated protein FliL
MRLLLVLLILVTLLGGGCYAAWTLYREPIEAKVTEILTPKEPPGVALPLEPITLPLFKGGQPDRFLTLEMSLICAGNDAMLRVKNQVPRLVDAYIQYLHSLANLRIQPGFEDLDFVKERLLNVSAQVVGPGEVRDILFRNAFEKPIQ